MIWISLILRFQKHYSNCRRAFKRIYFRLAPPNDTHLLAKLWGFNHDPQVRSLKANLPPTGKGNKDIDWVPKDTEHAKMGKWQHLNEMPQKSIRVNQFLKLGVLVTRRVSEEPVKILVNASGYQIKGPAVKLIAPENSTPTFYRDKPSARITCNFCRKRSRHFSTKSRFSGAM